MGHSHAPSPPYRDVGGRFARDAKNESEAELTGDRSSHDPHTSCHHHTPDLESEGDLEGTTARSAPSVHSAAPNRIVSSGDEPVLTGLDRIGPRVRFRSRVRISAGIARRRRFSDGLSSNASSISGSRSSSISAPLRTHYTGGNGWDPLGSRMKPASQATSTPGDDGNGAKTSSSWNGDADAPRRYARSSWSFLDSYANEHTHLLTSATRYSYVGRHVYDNYYGDEEREREQWREQVVDETFGKWPGRLLNRHWWWWHLEPVLCCFCEPDEDE